jgi:predicted regulator of Ras-like GTPase activity (Roadblock/LC7/MglB family)
MMFREPLEKILQSCEGAVACILMGFDGISVDCVSKDNELDIQTISMEFSFVLTQIRNAASILEVGVLEEVSIHSENLTFLIRVLDKDYFLGLAMKPDGNYGKGRHLMRMALSDVRAQL